MTIFNAFTTRLLVGITGTIVGATICFGAAASPAAARAADAAPAVAVSYADLDLASQSGRLQLARRIDHAAHTVCGWDNGVSIDNAPARRACIRRAVANATTHAPLSIASVASR